MDRKKKRLSADELAKEGEKKRKISMRLKEEMNEKTSKSNLNYRRKLDQRRVFLHITSWTDWNTLFLVFAFLSGASFLPFLLIWLTMSAPTFSFFDSFDFMLFMGFWTVFWVLCVFLAITQIKKKVIAEKKWIENLPFKLVAYPDVLVYRSYPSIYFTITFKNRKPELNYLLNILSSSKHEINSKIEYDLPEVKYDQLPATLIESLSGSSQSKKANRKITELPADAINVQFKFELQNDKASKFNRHRRWARKWIHQLCSVQYQAIHDKFPIESIVLNNGVTELDFDWWVPRKNWWRFF